MRRIIAVGALGLVGVFSVAACGTQTPVHPAEPPTSEAPTSEAPRQQATPSQAPGAVGQTFEVRGVMRCVTCSVTGGDTFTANDVDVTLVKVIDPAQLEQGLANTEPGAGEHFVATVFTIEANKPYWNGGNVYVAVTGTDGQRYSSQSATMPPQGYTNLNGRTLDLAPGQSATGAVVNVLPDGVSISTVSYDTQFGPTSEWSVSK